MPEDAAEWKQLEQDLAEDHHAKIIERQVNALDRTVVDQMYRGSGDSPYDPIVMLKMVLYQYLKGNQSPTAWFEEAKYNLAMRWLGRGYEPARRTWYDFRDRVGRFIEQLHEQIIAGAITKGFLDPSVGVQDGTAIAACASRHRTVTRPTLEKRKRHLEAILSGQFDEEEPRWVPPTDSGKHQLAERMELATAVLAKRIEKNAEKPNDKRRDPEKIQVSLSDPWAPLGRDKLKVFRPLYTVQYVVAQKSNLIMSYGCEPSVTDAGTLAPMIDQTQRVTGGKLTSMLADAAYCSILDLQDCQDRNVELLAPVQSNSFTQSKKEASCDQQIPRRDFAWCEDQQRFHCPQGHPLKYESRCRKKRHSGRSLWESRYRCDEAACKGCPLAKKCLWPGSRSRTIKRLEGQELLDAQREKMSTTEAQERYRLRGQTVELAYADSKGNRNLNRFHGRGPERARTETGIMVVAQNLRRIDRLQRNRTNSSTDTT